VSEKPSPEETALWQRRLAAQANNRAWALAESTSRTADEDEEMLQAAHAAMHFWKIVGDAKNRAHAAQLVAHVYGLLGLGNPAAYYLAKTGRVFFEDGAEPWESALAHAVAANVAAARKDASLHQQHYIAASEQIAALTDPEDKAALDATLRVVPAP
jgi:hypothetical protein